MIEIQDKKHKVFGYIDGNRYLNKKKRLSGFLEANTAKDKNGYPLLILMENGDITYNEGERVGNLENNKIYSYDGTLIFELSKEKNAILDSNGEAILYFKGDIEELGASDFFGIAAIYLELFA